MVVAAAMPAPVRKRARGAVKGKASAKSRRPSWRVAFPVTETDIPPYDALADEACKFTKSDWFKREILSKCPPLQQEQEKRQRREQELHMQLQQERRRCSTAPAKARRGKPAEAEAGGAARGKPVPRARAAIDAARRVSVQAVSDEDKDIELRALKAVLRREQLVESALATAEDSRRRRECFDLIQAAAAAGVEVVEAVAKWQQALDHPAPFIFDSCNYLLKMTRDLDALGAGPPAFMSALAGFLGHPDGFSAVRNPFMTREGLPPRGSFTEADLADYLKTTVFVGDTTAASNDLPLTDTGYIPLLNDRRVHAAQYLLLAEELRAAQGQAIDDASLDVRLDLLATQNPPRREHFRAAAAGKAAADEATTAATVTIGKPSSARQAADHQRGTLAPLTRADLRAMRKDAQSRLQRMDAELDIARRGIQALELALSKLEAPKKKSKSPKRKSAKLAPLSEQEAMLRRKLKYRRMDLAQKELARGRFLTSRAELLTRRIASEVRSGLERPLSGGSSDERTPAPAPRGRSREARRAAARARVVRVTALSTAADAISAGIAVVVQDLAREERERERSALRSALASSHEAERLRLERDQADAAAQLRQEIELREARLRRELEDELARKIAVEQARCEAAIAEQASVLLEAEEAIRAERSVRQREREEREAMLRHAMASAAASAAASLAMARVSEMPRRARRGVAQFTVSYVIAEAITRVMTCAR